MFPKKKRLQYRFSALNKKTYFINILVIYYSLNLAGYANSFSWKKRVLNCEMVVTFLKKIILYL